ncbi:tumor necrosis factor receptor superfamily member 4 [Cheilinus undulatus]|uniref:tumor necrosis factor receptor superfamily member 4 n=1 Tax=Cheilinus undulatus TaxID=241271 RepID=UPI001BD40F04|nr:tumor necrosis factor receptor superfamily member 4 [Cheilinus undulatus]
MAQLKWILFTFTFCELIIRLDAKKCPKGQRVANSGCAPCPPGYYQPEENNSSRCKQCTRCDEESGSFVQELCTTDANTRCQCREGFVPSDRDSSTCKCDKGSGKMNGECSKCEVGYFNNRIDSPCQKWKKCNVGENVSGTPTSDVICSDESKTDIKKAPTSNKTEPLSTQSTTKPSHEGGETQRKETTTTPLIVTVTSGHGVTPWQRVHPTDLPNTGYIGVALLIFVIALLMLTAVICKLYINPRSETRPAEQTRDSYRRPVEESGDGDDSQSSLKQCPGEP